MARLPSFEQVEAEMRRVRFNTKYFRLLRSTVYALIVTAAVSVLVATLFLPVLQIYGTSMSPTLTEGEIVVSIKQKEYTRGDIIALYYSNKVLVKRIIGVGDDVIQLTDEGTFIINGEELVESYISKKAYGDLTDMGHDMLEKSGYTNKYIIFLSDGFPPTYVKSGYTGYDPYTSGGTKGADGVFYDYVTGYCCSYGTSYSDKAAIRAREQATEIKNAGAKIFSVGIDIGGQTIAGYDGRSGLSVIDRTSTTYEIGSASSKDAYKNWLGSSIGSGYYYDSTNTAGLIQAYRQIFNELKTLTEEQNSAKWIASDPMPLNNIDGEPIMEFIGFYDRAGDLQVYDKVTGLVGSSLEGGENTISFDGEKNAISWDLKNSGYATTDSNSAIQYGYQVVYRVRLKNELNDFVENQPYNTNGETTLVYRHVEIENGVVQISQDKTINFPIPAVKGYLGELTFKKVTPDGSPLQGAVFELRHDEISCPYCRGDGLTYVAEVENHIFTASSGADGIVSFTRIPSGHTYSLVETVCPEGYYTDGSAYSVVVAYDNVTVTETYLNGSERVWNLTGGDTLIIANQTSVELPETGSSGELIFYILSVTAAAAALLTGGGVLLFRRKHSVRR